MTKEFTYEYASGTLALENWTKLATNVILRPIPVTALTALVSICKLEWLIANQTLKDL